MGDYLSKIDYENVSLEDPDEILNGTYFYYYDKEKKRVKHKISYVNGKLHGSQFSYHENGKVSQVSTYVNGIKDNLTITFSESGRITSKINYKKGKISR